MVVLAADTQGGMQGPCHPVYCTHLSNPRLLAGTSSKSVWRASHASTAVCSAFDWSRAASLLPPSHPAPNFLPLPSTTCRRRARQPTGGWTTNLRCSPGASASLRAGGLSWMPSSRTAALMRRRPTWSEGLHPQVVERGRGGVVTMEGAGGGKGRCSMEGQVKTQLTCSQLLCSFL